MKSVCNSYVVVTDVSFTSVYLKALGNMLVKYVLVLLIAVTYTLQERIILRPYHLKSSFSMMNPWMKMSRKSNHYYEQPVSVNDIPHAPGPSVSTKVVKQNEKEIHDSNSLTETLFYPQLGPQYNYTADNREIINDSQRIRQLGGPYYEYKKNNRLTKDKPYIDYNKPSESSDNVQKCILSIIRHHLKNKERPVFTPSAVQDSWPEFKNVLKINYYLPTQKSQSYGYDDSRQISLAVQQNEGGYYVVREVENNNNDVYKPQMQFKKAKHQKREVHGLIHPQKTNIFDVYTHRDFHRESSDFGRGFQDVPLTGKMYDPKRGFREVKPNENFIKVKDIIGLFVNRHKDVLKQLKELTSQYKQYVFFSKPKPILFKNKKSLNIEKKKINSITKIKDVLSQTMPTTTTTEDTPCKDKENYDTKTLTGFDLSTFYEGRFHENKSDHMNEMDVSKLYDKKCENISKKINELDFTGLDVIKIYNLGNNTSDNAGTNGRNFYKLNGKLETTGDARKLNLSKLQDKKSKNLLRAIEKNLYEKFHDDSKKRKKRSWSLNEDLNEMDIFNLYSHELEDNEVKQPDRYRFPTYTLKKEDNFNTQFYPEFNELTNQETIKTDRLVTRAGPNITFLNDMSVFDFYLYRTKELGALKNRLFKNLDLQKHGKNGEIAKNKLEEDLLAIRFPTTASSVVRTTPKVVGINLSRIYVIKKETEADENKYLYQLDKKPLIDRFKKDKQPELIRIKLSDVFPSWLYTKINKVHENVAPSYIPPKDQVKKDYRFYPKSKNHQLRKLRNRMKRDNILEDRNIIFSSVEANDEVVNDKPEKLSPYYFQYFPDTEKLNVSSNHFRRLFAIHTTTTQVPYTIVRNVKNFVMNHPYRVSRVSFKMKPTRRQQDEIGQLGPLGVEFIRSFPHLNSGEEKHHMKYDPLDKSDEDEFPVANLFEALKGNQMIAKQIEHSIDDYLMIEEMLFGKLSKHKKRWDSSIKRIPSYKRGRVVDLRNDDSKFGKKRHHCMFEGFVNSYPVRTKRFVRSRDRMKESRPYKLPLKIYSKEQGVLESDEIIRQRNERIVNNSYMPKGKEEQRNIMNSSGVPSTKKFDAEESRKRRRHYFKLVKSTNPVGFELMNEFKALNSYLGYNVNSAPVKRFKKHLDIFFTEKTSKPAGITRREVEDDDETSERLRSLKILKDLELQRNLKLKRKEKPKTARRNFSKSFNFSEVRREAEGLELPYLHFDKRSVEEEILETPDKSIQTNLKRKPRGTSLNEDSFDYFHNAIYFDRTPDPVSRTERFALDLKDFEALQSGTRAEMKATPPSVALNHRSNVDENIKSNDHSGNSDPDADFKHKKISAGFDFHHVLRDEEFSEVDGFAKDLEQNNKQIVNPSPSDFQGQSIKIADDSDETYRREHNNHIRLISLASDTTTPSIEDAYLHEMQDRDSKTIKQVVTELRAIDENENSVQSEKDTKHLSIIPRLFSEIDVDETTQREKETRSKNVISHMLGYGEMGEIGPNIGENAKNEAQMPAFLANSAKRSFLEENEDEFDDDGAPPNSIKTDKKNSVDYRNGVQEPQNKNDPENEFVKDESSKHVKGIVSSEDKDIGYIPPDSENEFESLYFSKTEPKSFIDKEFEEMSNTHFADAFSDGDVENKAQASDVPNSNPLGHMHHFYDENYQTATAMFTESPKTYYHTHATKAINLNPQGHFFKENKQKLAEMDLYSDDESTHVPARKNVIQNDNDIYIAEQKTFDELVNAHLQFLDPTKGPEQTTVNFEDKLLENHYLNEMRRKFQHAADTVTYTTTPIPIFEPQTEPITKTYIKAADMFTESPKTYYHTHATESINLNPQGNFFKEYKQKFQPTPESPTLETPTEAPEQSFTEAITHTIRKGFTEEQLKAKIFTEIPFETDGDGSFMSRDEPVSKHNEQLKTQSTFITEDIEYRKFFTEAPNETDIDIMSHDEPALKKNEHFKVKQQSTSIKEQNRKVFTETPNETNVDSSLMSPDEPVPKRNEQFKLKSQSSYIKQLNKQHLDDVMNELKNEQMMKKLHINTRLGFQKEFGASEEKRMSDIIKPDSKRQESDRQKTKKKIVKFANRTQNLDKKINYNHLEEAQSLTDLMTEHINKHNVKSRKKSKHHKTITPATEENEHEYEYDHNLRKHILSATSIPEYERAVTDFDLEKHKIELEQEHYLDFHRKHDKQIFAEYNDTDTEEKPIEPRSMTKKMHSSHHNHRHEGHIKQFPGIMDNFKDYAGYGSPVASPKNKDHSGPGDLNTGGNQELLQETENDEQTPKIEELFTEDEAKTVGMRSFEESHTEYPQESSRIKEPQESMMRRRLKEKKFDILENLGEPYEENDVRTEHSAHTRKPIVAVNNLPVTVLPTGSILPGNYPRENHEKEFGTKIGPKFPENYDHQSRPNIKTKYNGAQISDHRQAYETAAKLNRNSLNIGAPPHMKGPKDEDSTEEPTVESISLPSSPDPESFKDVPGNENVLNFELHKTLNIEPKASTYVQDRRYKDYINEPPKTDYIEDSYKSPHKLLNEKNSVLENNPLIVKVRESDKLKEDFDEVPENRLKKKKKKKIISYTYNKKNNSQKEIILDDSQLLSMWGNNYKKPRDDKIVGDLGPLELWRHNHNTELQGTKVPVITKAPENLNAKPLHVHKQGQQQRKKPISSEGFFPKEEEGYVRRKRDLEEISGDDKDFNKRKTKRPRLLCFVLKKSNDGLVEHVKNTWGKRCDLLLFISSQEAEQQSPWEYTKAGLRFVYDVHFHSAEWFLKADLDSFIVVENLRHMIEDYDYNEALYFGRPKQLDFNNFVLSREALYSLVNESGETRNCIGLDAAGEGIGSCLTALKIEAIKTVDPVMRPLFYPFGPFTWDPSQNYSHSPEESFDSWSDYAVAFKGVSDVDMYVIEYLTYRVYPYNVPRSTLEHLTRDLEKPEDPFRTTEPALKNYLKGYVHDWMTEGYMLVDSNELRSKS